MSSGPRVSLHFVMWMLTLIVLLSVLVHAGKKLQADATQTGYEVAVKRMLTKANYYKDHWILQDSPNRMMINGQELLFNENGWPTPLKDNVLDCEYWLILLNDQQDVFGLSLQQVDGEITPSGYICTYRYTEQNAIMLKLENKRLLISVNS